MDDEFLQSLERLLAAGGVGPLVTHFERRCGVDIDRSEFFDRLRDLHDASARHPAPAAGELVRNGVSLTLSAWGDYRLGLLGAEPADHIRRRLQAESVQSGHERAVIDGLARFFTHTPVPMDGQVALTGLTGQFRRLAELGYGPDRQGRAALHWLIALFRQGEWRAAARVAGEFLAAHWWPLWSALRWPDALAVVAELLDLPPAERELVAATLAGWLRAVAQDPADALLDDAGPQLIPVVAATALTVWEDHRDRAAAVEEADNDDCWGGWLWALEALVGRLRYVRERRDDRSLALLLANHLECFATRMALVHVPNVGLPNVSLECGPDNPAILDPYPDAAVGRSNQLPFPDARVANGGPPTEVKFPARDRTAPRCDPALYRELTDELEVGRLGAVLPLGAAYLALADLPISHTPVGMLLVRGPDGSALVEVAVGGAGLGSDHTDLEDALRGFDAATADEWEQYKSDHSTRRLASRLTVLSEQRADTLNTAYGPVVDELFHAMAARGLSRQYFRNVDLLVAARGLAQFAPTELLGTACRVADWSASVSHVPSLSVVAHLRQRAAKDNERAGPVRLAAAGWEPVRLGQDGLSFHPGHGDGVLRLMDCLLRSFGGRAGWHLQMAAEDPIASLSRVARLLEVADIGVLFGHGRTAPCGLRLADGLFPDDLAAPVTRGPAVLLLACCYAGRLGQMEGRADGFSPIVDEVVMRLMLSEGVFTTRRPNLVGAFVEAVPTVTGAGLVCDLLRERVRGVDASGGFGLARAFRRVLERYQAAGQGPDGLGLLRVFTARSWRLFGIEPPVAWPVV